MYCSICNNLYDVVDYKPKDEEKKKKNSSVFMCVNCNTQKLIPSGTVIHTRIYGKRDNTTIKKQNLINMRRSKILTNTREYTCPKDKCESHTNVNKREAVMFRMYEQADIVYICKTCDTKF